MFGFLKKRDESDLVQELREGETEKGKKGGFLNARVRLMIAVGVIGTAVLGAVYFLTAPDEEPVSVSAPVSQPPPAPASAKSLEVPSDGTSVSGNFSSGPSFSVSSASSSVGTSDEPENLPEAPEYDRERDVFVEFYIDKLRREKEAEEGIEERIDRRLVQTAPFHTDVNIPVLPPPDAFPESPVEEELEEIRVYSIVCAPSCYAYTNLGKLSAGDRVGNSEEKVIRITPFEIETDRRVIRW